MSDPQENAAAERPVVVVAGCKLPNDLTIEKERLAPLGVHLVDGRNLPQGELNNQLERATALLTEGFVALDRVAIQRLKRCKIVSFYSIGVETIDLDAASDLGIVVTNAPGYCTDEVADHAMLLLLAAWRKAPAALRLTRKTTWNIDSLRPIYGLRGRTLGLVGYGGIAQAMAVRARAFGMNIIAYDPYVAKDLIDASTKLLSLEALLASSDVVSIHLPLTPETKGLVGKEQIGLLHERVVLINTSRGGVVDEAALVEALLTKRIAGAGLDVLAVEPPSGSSSSRLLDLDNVICTPHMAYYSEDSLRNVRGQATDAVANALMGRPPIAHTWVNRPRAPHKTGH